MSFFSKIRRVYRQNKALRILLQLAVLFSIYMGVRYWQSIGNISGIAPIVKGQTIDGEFVDLREYQSKPVLVHFWATWCQVCQLENKNIESVSKDYQVITIASWSESASVVAEYLANNDIQMPVIVDEYAEWAKLYAVKAVPTSFIIDSQGVIRFIERGYTTEAGLRLRLWWLENNSEI